MSTTSPNFALVLANSTDQVDVANHIANNFSTIDTLLSVVHTGTGQLKDGLTFVNPTLNGVVTVTGTVSASIVSASTGSFQTITATGGALTINTLTVGTMAIPAAIGSSGHLLGVSGGVLTFLAPSAASGPNNALSNLASVAINTNLNTFTAGFVTVARVIATSGSLTGLTAFQSTTGTFSNLTVLTTASIPTLIGTNATVTNIVVGFVTATGVTMASGTATALTVTSAAVSTGIFTALTATAVVATNATLANATVSGTATIARVVATTAVAATLTASAIQIGTYSLPATVGSTGQILTVTTGNVVFASSSGQALTTAYFRVRNTGGGLNITTVSLAGTAIPLDTKIFDVGSGFNTAASTYTVTSSGYYEFGGSISIFATTQNRVYTFALSGSGGPHVMGSVIRVTASDFAISGSVILSAGSGAVYTPFIYVNAAATGTVSAPTVDIYHTGTFYSYFWGMKIPDA